VDRQREGDEEERQGPELAEEQEENEAVGIEDAELLDRR
jgi:hypothetical protein